MSWKRQKRETCCSPYHSEPEQQQRSKPEASEDYQRAAYCLAYPV